MRVLRDVAIVQMTSDELHAVSHVAGMAGEEMTLDMMGGGTTLGLKVKVIDSRPVMIEGAVRHRIRLALLKAETEASVASAADVHAVAAGAADAETVNAGPVDTNAQMEAL